MFSTSSAKKMWKNRSWLGCDVGFPTRTIFAYSGKMGRRTQTAKPYGFDTVIWIAMPIQPKLHVPVVFNSIEPYDIFSYFSWMMINLDGMDLYDYKYPIMILYPVKDTIRFVWWSVWFAIRMTIRAHYWNNNISYGVLRAHPTTPLGGSPTGGGSPMAL